MSVYSGFATRKQESFYNKLLEKLLQILTRKILSTIPYNQIASILEDPAEFNIHNKTLIDLQQKYYSNQHIIDNVLYSSFIIYLTSDKIMSLYQKNYVEMLIKIRRDYKRIYPQLIQQKNNQFLNFIKTIYIQLLQLCFKYDGDSQQKLIDENQQIIQKSYDKSTTENYKTEQKQQLNDLDLKFMKFDDKKWAKQLVMIYKHMNLLEKNKYLEPALSFQIIPLVKYCINQYKLKVKSVSSSYQYNYYQISHLEFILI